MGFLGPPAGFFPSGDLAAGLAGGFFPSPSGLAPGFFSGCGLLGVAITQISNHETHQFQTTEHTEYTEKRINKYRPLKTPSKLPMNSFSSFRVLRVFRGFIIFTQ